MLGKRIKTLINEDLHKGNHEIQCDAAELALGLYFYKMKAGDFHKTQQMILLK
jgi:hypothetical protein